MQGVISIFIIFLITTFVAARWPKIKKIILIAFILRFLLIIINNYFYNLPDNNKDAINFEILAWDLAQLNLFQILEYYNGPDPYFISWLISIPYYLFGRSLLLAQSISLFFGMSIVFFIWYFVRKIWNEDIANKISWIAALFPSQILYSILILRESYIGFFMVLACYGVITWGKNQNLKSFFFAITGFTGAIFFHGAMLVGLLVFLSFVLIDYLNNFFKKIKFLIINIKDLIFLLSTIIFFVLFIFNKFQVPYLNNFEYLMNLDNIIAKIAKQNIGGAAYPLWTIPKDKIDLILKIPIRCIYFLFSPFPWDIKDFSQSIGLLDSFLHICLFYLIFKNIKYIWNDYPSRILLFILLAYIFVFSIGVGNFGTGIRHKTKLFPIILFLIVPFINKLVSFKIKK